MFLVLDIFLTTLDVILDVSTSYQFYKNDETHWCLMNLCFMVMPSLGMFVTVFFEEFKNNGSKFSYGILNKALMRALLSLPFIQTFRAIRRFKEMREQAVFLTSAENLNKIKKENAEAAIFEAFLEAAPSQVLNIFIFLVTGAITETQVASTCTSVFSLSLAAERVYFHYRTEMDVDPSWRLKLLVLPCMLLNIISNTILWSVLAANSNIGILYCMLFVFIMNFAMLKTCNPLSSVELMQFSPFSVSLLSTWAPSTLGCGRRMFCSLAISSYTSKLFLIVVFWMLRWLDAPFLPYPPLTSCTSNNNISMAYCYSITECFCGFQCEDKKQKIRYFKTNSARGVSHLLIVWGQNLYISLLH